MKVALWAEIRRLSEIEKLSDRVIARRLPRISRPLTIFAYIPMLFTGGLVPLYLLVTQVLQLTNNWFAVILPIMILHQAQLMACASIARRYAARDGD